MFLFQEALWVTVASFASVALRYLPFQLLWGKARAVQLRGLWYWCYMLAMGGFLVRELYKFPNPAKRLPNSFRVSLPYYVNVPAHLAVWLSYLSTGYHLYQFRHCRRSAEEVVDLIFDVLLLPVSFGVLSVYCIRILPDRGSRDLWAATSTLDAAEVWESWALWSFQTLFMKYVEGSQDAQGELYPHFKRLCLLGVQQFVVFNFGSNFLEFLWRELDHHDPAICARFGLGNSTCEEQFKMLEDYIIGALWYSCTIAIYSIVSFERALSRSLHPIDPVWKFWGAKAIVSIAGMQRLFLFALTKLGFIASVFAWYLHAYFLCFETLLLSVVHFRAYPASGYFKFGSSMEHHYHHSGTAVAPSVYGKVGSSSPGSQKEQPSGPEDCEDVSAPETVPSLRHAVARLETSRHYQEEE